MRLRLEAAISISPATVNRFVLKGKDQGGQLYRGLRHQAKRRRKRYGTKDYRGPIPRRVDTADRPAVVETRSGVGDWEIDLSIGKDHQGAIVTLAERAVSTLSGLADPAQNGGPDDPGLITLFVAWKDWIHTITYDYGREFNRHTTIAKALDCQILCQAIPQLGGWLKRDSNGLLRQYLPKGIG